MSRTLVVGDIHGCFDEFLTLLEAAEITECDQVISVGDLIDRGPKSAEVVAYFAERPERFHAVRGNHEEKHLQHQNGPFPSLAGWILRRTIEEAAYKAMLNYLATLPYYLDLSDAIVVHAGLEPGVELIKQDPKGMMGVGSVGRAGFDGRSTWWYDSPEMSVTKPVIFGHEKYPEVVRGKFGNVWGIDTGAGMGGPLTGLILPEFRLVSVPVPDYWTMQQAIWRPLFREEKIPYMPWADLFALRDFPENGSGELAESLHKMLTDFGSAVAHIEEERSRFIQEHSYLELESKEKGELIRHIRGQEKMLSTNQAALHRCVLESLPSRDVGTILKDRFPNWTALKKAFLCYKVVAKNAQ